MTLAVDAVLNSGLSVWQTAQDCDVPKSTPSDHVIKHVHPRAVSGTLLCDVPLKLEVMTLRDITFNALKCTRST